MTQPELALLRGYLPARPCFRHVLERHVQLYPVARDLAVLDRQVLLHHLGDAEVAQRLGRGQDGDFGRRLPGLAAGPNELCNAINAVGHLDLLDELTATRTIVAPPAPSRVGPARPPDPSPPASSSGRHASGRR